MHTIDSQNCARDTKRKVLLIYRCYSSSFLAYPWIFARTGKVIVDVIAPKGHLIQHSVWVNRHVDVLEDEDFLDALCAAVANADYHDVFCVDEPSRSLMFGGGGREALQPYVPFRSNPRLQEAAVNKAKFQEWCEALGLRTPNSVTCHSSEAVHAAAKGFSYPYVLKATEGAGGQMVSIIRTREDLDEAVDAEGEGAEWIVQEYLGGCVGTTIFVAREGQLETHCSYRNICCTNEGIGPAAICEHVESDELSRIVNFVAEHVDGVTGFDWIESSDGGYVLIDPHFGRFAPTGACAHLFGVDFGQAYCARPVDGSCRPSEGKQCSVVWVFPQCLQLILEGGFLRAWRTAKPWDRRVRIFCFAPGEWRMFFLQLFDYLSGRARVVLGAWRRKLFR